MRTRAASLCSESAASLCSEIGPHSLAISDARDVRDSNKIGPHSLSDASEFRCRSGLGLFRFGHGSGG